MRTKNSRAIACAVAAAVLAAPGAHAGPTVSATEPTAASFVDDFDGAADPAWTSRDGYADQFPDDADHHASFVQGPGHLTISIPSGAEHNQWWLRHAEIRRPYAGSGVYEVKVDADFTGYQQVGLSFESSPGTFMHFMLYSKYHVNAYVERFAQVAGQQHKATVAGADTGYAVPRAGPWYLRVTVDDDTRPDHRVWRFEWSRNGADWVTVADGVLEEAAPEANAGEIRHVGVFAGNHPDEFSAFDAHIDSFSSRAEPGTAPPPETTVPPTTRPAPTTEPTPTTEPPTEPTPPTGGGAPSLQVQTVVSGLDIPWDVDHTPNGTMLFTERDRGTVGYRTPGGRRGTLVGNVPGLWVRGEVGLMSIVADPRFRKNRRFYLCHGWQGDGRPQVRVTAWKTDPRVTSARQVKVLVRGIPATSGRHGGCRLEIGRDGALYVGTGDAARSDTSRNLRSLGGKVLRVKRSNGHARPGNPFEDSRFARTRKIWTYGHRNVQGLAHRPGGRMWSVEHGTFRDDEVNSLRPGGDYGWQAGPGYDQSPPMTRFSLPGRQIAARWSSGPSTIATSGAAWLTRPGWGSWRGALAVATLEERSLRILRFDSRGRLRWQRSAPELRDRYGPLRSVELGPDGELVITTSNGDGNDRILVATPRR